MTFCTNDGFVNRRPRGCARPRPWDWLSWQAKRAGAASPRS